MKITESSARLPLLQFCPISGGAFSPAAILADASVLGTFTDCRTGLPRVQVRAEAEAVDVCPGRILVAHDSGAFVLRRPHGCLILRTQGGEEVRIDCPGFNPSAVDESGLVAGSLRDQTGREMGVTWMAGTIRSVHPQARTADVMTASLISGITHDGDLYVWSAHEGMKIYPADSARVWVNGMTPAGEVAGSVYRSCQQMSGFLHSAMRPWQEVPSFGGDRTCAAGVFGQKGVYGYATLADGRLTHFTWEPGSAPVALHTALLPATGARVTSLAAGNAVGRLAGIAQTESEAFLFVVHSA